ncbi:MAG: RluA family pseudouridine synthase [Ruminococcus sp.]
MRKLEIGKNDAGQRMDKYLKKYFREAGSGFLYKMLRKKNIVLNGKKAEGKEILAKGDIISLYLAEETIEKFRGKADLVQKAGKVYPVMPLEILYEDENLLFINKPAGVLSQKASSRDVSMVEYLIGYLLEQGKITEKELETFHPSVCNRLDRNTSGLILAGKSLEGLQKLSQVLKERSMKKYYLCLVKGEVKKKTVGKAWLLKDQKKNQVQVYSQPVSGAALIETAYEPLWSDGAQTLLKVDLITGKSHQIRCHLASLGYPLAGDEKYGDERWNREWKKKTGLSRQFLHAWEICFPQEEDCLKALSKKTVQAPLPEDLKKVLESIEVKLGA